MDFAGYVRSYYLAFPPGLRVVIQYQDEQGVVTTRVIIPKSYFQAYDGREFLKAWCCLRNAERTFRMDRIIDARFLEEPSREPSADFSAGAAGAAEGAGAARASGPAGAAGAFGPAGAAQAATPIKRKKSHHYLLKAACAAFIISCVRGYFKESESGRYSTPSYTRTVIAKIVKSSNPAPARPPPPVKATQVAAARATPAPLRPSSVGGSARVASPGVTATPAKQPGRSSYEITIEKNSALFTRETGISDKGLLSLYASADANRDASLSWSEIAAFQRNLYERYAYRHNNTALRPDEFIAAGGGDCDDWSLVTAGLLRYWGYDPYIGAIRSPDGSEYHAVCLIRVAERPPAYAYYHFDEDGHLNGRPIKAGYYVPIDYDNVGTLSNAVKGHWKLHRMYRPESIYGALM